MLFVILNKRPIDFPPNPLTANSRRFPPGYQPLQAWILSHCSSRYPSCFCLPHIAASNDQLLMFLLLQTHFIKTNTPFSFQRSQTQNNLLYIFRDFMANTLEMLVALSYTSLMCSSKNIWYICRLALWKMNLTVYKLSLASFKDAI